MWKDIKTAPTNGSRFLAWAELGPMDEEDEDGNVVKRGIVEHYAVVAYFCFGGFVEFPWRGSFVQNLKFTHWMPLPAGPR